MTRLPKVVSALSFLAAAVLWPLPARAQPVGSWVWANPLPQGDSLHQVRFLDDGFVAVGGAGRILVGGPLGTGWTVRHSGVVEPLHDVAWSGFVYAAVGDSGRILTSPDTLTWTPQTSGTGLRLRGVTWDGSQFVAVGDNGKVLTSPDGTEWVPRVSNTTSSLGAVTRGGALLAAVGDNGTIVTSPDGTVWTVRSSGITHNFTGIAWSGARFVASAFTPLPPEIEKGFFVRSDDGISWTPQSMPGHLPSDVTWTGGAFKAVGRRVQSSVVVTLSSPDGVAWTEGPLKGMFTPAGIAWSGSAFAVVGELGRIMSSLDGVVWNPRSRGPRNDLRALAWSGQRYVAVGNAKHVLTSTNGVLWTRHPLGADEYLSALAWGNGKFVALGSLGVVMTSPDGLTWTQHASLPVNNFNDLIFNGTKFVGVGHTVNNGVIVTSTDGVNWTIVNTPLPVMAVAWNGFMHVAVGALGSVLTSPNAVTWTPQSSGTTELLDGITFCSACAGGSPFFVAVGYGNPATILISGEGVFWFPVNSGTNLPLLDVAYNGEFIAVGQSGVVLRSSNGVGRWTRDDWATESTLHDIDAFSVGGPFFAVGDWGTLVRQD